MYLLQYTTLYVYASKTLGHYVYVYYQGHIRTALDVYVRTLNFLS